jgi:Ribbon-helix-helix domain
MEEEAVRWNIKVSKATDLRGAKKGDLSKFIEDAVRWRVFHQTVQDIRERNADMDPDELQRIIDETVSEVRAERYAKRKGAKV